MKKKFFIFFLCIFQVFCFYGDADMDSNSTFYLSKNQLEEYTNMALNGDEEKASAIFEYYSIYDYQSDEASYWAKIGAENGSKVADYNYGCILKEINEDYFRSYYFLKKASDKNVESATKVLSFLLKKIDKERILFLEKIILPDIIDAENINIFFEAARIGNIKASESLVNYYEAEYIKTSFGENIERNIKNNPYIYWLQIGCENGSVKCITTYSELLQSSITEYDRIRAKFWIKKI